MRGEGGISGDEGWNFYDYFSNLVPTFKLARCYVAAFVVVARKGSLRVDANGCNTAVIAAGLPSVQMDLASLSHEPVLGRITLLFSFSVSITWPSTSDWNHVQHPI
jgi:hypothetical protein